MSGDAAGLANASLGQTAALLAGVILPAMAKGPLLRRDAVMRLAGQFQLDAQAIARMRQLRERHGKGPVVVSLAGRRHAILLDPDDARRVLRETPDPFATGTAEKHAALVHFEPRNVLVSSGPERAERRGLNETALDWTAPVHRAAARVLDCVDRARDDLTAGGGFDWPAFRARWLAMSRDILLGPSAAEDLLLARELDELRGDANWAVLRPVRKRKLERFLARLAAHLALAEEGSVAAPLAERQPNRRGAPLSQIAHWLFAFDAAGITTLRALALLHAHPGALERARGESGDNPERPFLRAAVLDTVRLWPTTPLILRETTGSTDWRGGALPAGTGIVIFAPYFHRDPDRLPFSDQFAPEVWLDGQAEAYGLLPFSAGPAACPGRNLVLLTASAMLAGLLAAGPRVEGSPLRPGERMPATFDHTRLLVSFGGVVARS